MGRKKLTPQEAAEAYEKYRRRARHCTRSVYLGKTRDQQRWDMARKLAKEQSVPMGEYLAHLIAKDLGLE